MGGIERHGGARSGGGPREQVGVVVCRFEGCQRGERFTMPLPCSTPQVVDPS